MTKTNMYVALLRGINVGGNHLIKMVDLKECFESMGYAGVTTYIQSGNVIFESPETNIGELESKIEKTLSRTFDYESRLTVRSHKQLKKIVEHAPAWFGKDASYKHNVIFIKKPATPAQAMQVVTLKEGVDKVAAGDDVLYVSTLLAAGTKSSLPRLVGTKVYQYMTIRNSNTVLKLLQLAERTPY